MLCSTITLTIIDYIDDCIADCKRSWNKVNCCWNQVDLLPLLSIQFVVRSLYPTKSTTALPANECSFDSNFPHKCVRSYLVVAHLVLTRSPYPQIGETYFYTGLLIWSSTRVSVYGICRVLSNDKQSPLKNNFPIHSLQVNAQKKATYLILETEIQVLHFQRTVQSRACVTGGISLKSASVFAAKS